MKTRESGMPDESVWSGFFSPEETLAKLGLTAACRDVVDFGCGYGTFAVPAARLVGGTVYALDIDAEMPLEEVDWATHALLSQIEPCGVDNPQAVLLSRGVEVRDRRAIGSGQKHLKLTLRDGRGVAWDAIFFRQGELLSQVPARIDVAYTLEANEWNHRRQLQLNVQDLKTA